MPSSSEILATLCLCGGLIRLLTSALTASLYPRIGHVLKPPGVLMRGVTTFLKPGALVGLFQRGSADLPWFAGLWPRMKGQIIRESMALPVVSAAPGSLLLFDSLQCSFHSLNAYQPSLTSALLDITRPAIRRRLRALQEPMIGINVRCGKDFRSPPRKAQAANGWDGCSRRRSVGSVKPC